MEHTERVPTASLLPPYTVAERIRELRMRCRAWRWRAQRRRAHRQAWRTKAVQRLAKLSASVRARPTAIAPEGLWHCKRIDRASYHAGAATGQSGRCQPR